MIASSALIRLSCLVGTLSALVSSAQTAVVISTRSDPIHGEMRLRRTVVGEFNSQVGQSSNAAAPAIGKAGEHSSAQSQGRVSNTTLSIRGVPQPCVGKRVVFDIVRSDASASNRTTTLWEKRGAEYTEGPGMATSFELCVYDYHIVSNSLYVVYSQGDLMVEKVALLPNEAAAAGVYTLRRQTTWTRVCDNAKIVFGQGGISFDISYGGNRWTETKAMPKFTDIERQQLSDEILRRQLREGNGRTWPVVQDEDLLKEMARLGIEFHTTPAPSPSPTPAPVSSPRR